MKTKNLNKLNLKELSEKIDNDRLHKAFVARVKEEIAFVSSELAIVCSEFILWRHSRSTPKNEANGYLVHMFCDIHNHNEARFIKFVLPMVEILENYVRVEFSSIDTLTEVSDLLFKDR